MKKKVKYRRTGRCNSCGMCCLLKDGMRFYYKDSKADKENIKLALRTGWMKVHEIKKKIYLSRMNPCIQLYINWAGKFKCGIHGRLKPKVCKIHPHGPPDHYWLIIKKFCGFKFKKIKGGETNGKSNIK